MPPPETLPVPEPLPEETVGSIVAVIAQRTGIGEGQIRLAFDNACR